MTEQENAPELSMRFVELPSLETMRQRCLLAEDTPYQEWANDALFLSIAVNQAQQLAFEAKRAHQHPMDVMTYLSSEKMDLHHSLEEVRHAIISHAARVWVDSRPTRWEKVKGAIRRLLRLEKS